MKAGLTVLVAVATASVNTHVKVETVNFDEDLLNTEKNIAETSAWKEKKDKKEGPQPQEKEETDEPQEKPEGDDGEPGITVTFEVKKFEGEEVGHFRCDGKLTMKSHGMSGELHLLNLNLDTILEADFDRVGILISINHIEWLKKSRNQMANKEEREVASDIWKQMSTAREKKGTMSWEISETMLKEGDVMRRTLNVINSLK